MKKTRLKSNLITNINEIPFVDTELYSPKYFAIYDVPDRLYLGKSSFRISVNPKNLVKDSRIYVDVLDSQGNPVYYEIGDKLLSDNSRLITIEIYDDSVIGVGQIILAGRCTQYNGVPIRTTTSELDIPNLLYVHEVLISPDKTTDDEIIFTNNPTVSASLVTVPLKTTTDLRQITIDQTSAGQTSLTLLEGTSNTSIEVITTSLTDSKISTFTKTKKLIMTSTNPIFVRDMINSNIVINDVETNFQNQLSAEQLLQYTEYLASGGQPINTSPITGIISEVLDLYHVIVIADINLPVKFKDFTIKSLINFNFSIDYKTSLPELTDSQTVTYINFQFDNLEMSSGFVESVEIGYRPFKDIGSYNNLGKHQIVKPQSIFGTDWLFDMSGAINQLKSPASDYWTLTNLLFMKSDKIDNCPKFQTDNLSTPGYLISNNTFNFKADSIYKLKFKYYSAATSGKINIFVLGDKFKSFATELLPVDEPNSNLIGSIDLSKGNAEKVFYFKSLDEQNVGIELQFSQDPFSVTLIEFDITPDSDKGFNPSEYNIKVPFTNFKEQIELEFKIEYLNEYNRKSEFITYLDGVRFDNPPAVIDKTYIGLENVDNTSDINKPVSTATAAELATKYPNSNPSGFETPAQLNDRDTANRSRSNHTGSQAISTVSGLQTELDTLTTSLNTKLSSTILNYGTIGSLTLNFNNNTTVITNLSEGLTLNNVPLGAQNKPTNLIIYDGGTTSQSITYGSDWIGLNGSLPTTTDKKMIHMTVFKTGLKIYAIVNKQP